VLKHLLATAGQSEDRIPVKVRFSAPAQTGPGALPSLLIQWVSGLFHGGRALTTNPHLGPRLKKEYSYTSSPLCLHVLFWGNLYLYLLTEWRTCCVYRIHKTKRLFSRGTQALIFFLLTQLHVSENNNHHRATKRNLKVK
jgi:hypothetical protein